MKTLKELDAICLDAYTSEDIAAFKRVFDEKAAAIFVYNKNVFYQNKTEQIDPDNYRVKPEYRCGVVYAPLTVFERVGVSIDKDVISLGDKTVKLAEISTFEKYGLTFVPVIETARELGLSTISLYKNRLVVFGTEAVTDALAEAIKENPAIEFAGGGAVIGEYDATKFTAQDFKQAKDKWRASIVATPETIDTTDEVLLVMINHGKNPKDATYAYAVLPYASEEKTTLYAKTPEVEIVSNTPVCQAVRKPSLGVTGIIFYEAGECCGIKVDTACLVTFMEKDGEFKIKVAEPTNKVDAVTVEISKRLALKSADRHCTAECAEVTKLTVKTELSVGEGYETVFYVNE